MTRGRAIGAAVVAAVAIGVACGQDEAAAPAKPSAAGPQPPAASPAPPSNDATAHAEAQEIFATRCVTCHGPNGAGDGPASAGLTPPPRNFQDPAWQTSVDDDHIEKIIKYGGAAVGRSVAMPGNPDLNAKPAVVAALREHIRGLAAE